MQLLDARKLRHGETLRADVCIVGSGPAGITLALELADSGLEVLLLESGGLSVASDVQDLNAGRQLGINTWSLHDWRLRVFGGTSGHWTGLCRPLSPEDFTVREWVPGSGWPIDFDTLRPYYERAHATCELGEFDYDAKRMSERLGLPLLTDDDSVLEHRFYRLSPPTRFGTRYREPLEHAGALRIYLNGTLAEIVLQDDLNSVARLRCGTLQSGAFSVEAERYVLALGGLENPRLLLASSAQLEDGVANSSGLVGRYFMEHPHYLRSATIAWQSSIEHDFFRSRYGLLCELEGSASIGLLGALGLRSEVRASEGLLNLTLGLLVGDTLALTDTGSIGAGTTAALLGYARNSAPVARVSCRCEQAPQQESRLTLSKQLDALGVPRIELDWRVSERDERSIYRALQLVGNELGRLGLGRLWTPHADGAIDWKISPAGHHMGTTRMGDDAASSVVDANLRCHDHDNLYIAGASVFVTGGDANPTLTLVALAHRLADHLRGEP
jgi:choline dehydrogenase-like flavoprotein